MLWLCVLPDLLCLLTNLVPSQHAKLLVALISLLSEVARGRAAVHRMLVALLARGKGRGAAQAGGAAQPASSGSLAKCIRQQGRTR